MINQEQIAIDNIIGNGYVKVERQFKIGDSVELLLEMKPLKDMQIHWFMQIQVKLYYKES